MSDPDDKDKKDTKGKRSGGGGGGEDVSKDTKFLGSFLGQALGRIATILGRRGFHLGPIKALLALLTTLIGEQGTIQAINLLVAGLQSSGIITQIVVALGGSQANARFVIEVLEELFDGIVEEFDEKGRLTEADSNKVLGSVLKSMEDKLDTRATFAWAATFLTVEEQVKLAERVIAFCQNPEDAQRFDTWRLKLNNPGMLRVLLQLDVASWRAHLRGLLGDVAVSSSKTKGNPFLKKMTGLVQDLFQQGPNAPAVREFRAAVGDTTEEVRGSRTRANVQLNVMKRYLPKS